MSNQLKTVITIKDKDGNDVKLAIVPPSAQQQLDARLTHAKAYKDALEAGAMMREELDKFLRKSKLWDDERQAEAERLKKVLLDGELKLRKGGMKLKEAKELALQMADARLQFHQLFSERNAMETETADAYADQARFNFMVAICTVYDKDRKPYFTKDGEHPSVDDYIERSTEDSAFEIAMKLNEILNPDSSFDVKKLPENGFLLKYKFVNDDLHLIDEKGRKVDRKGRLVNDKGYFVNENNERVDGDGNKIDEDGNYLVDSQPFLDDDGKPIVEEKPEPLPAPKDDVDVNPPDCGFGTEGEVSLAEPNPGAKLDVVPELVTYDNVIKKEDADKGKEKLEEINNKK